MRAFRRLRDPQVLETSLAGRAAISGFLLVTLTSLAALNLPDSHLSRALAPVARSYSHAFGVDQSWSLFAPDPRTAVVTPEARILYDDGTAAAWPGPDPGGPLAEYVTHRRQKWAEWLTNDRYAFLRRPAAEWLARRYASGARRPVRVELSRRVRPLAPPGEDELRARAETIYVLELGSGP